MIRQEQTRASDDSIAGAAIAPDVRPHEARQPGALRRAWRGWLRFAEIIGTAQMVIILSLVYWTLLAIMALFLKLLADPLALRRSHRSLWAHRQNAPDILDAMRRQF